VSFNYLELAGGGSFRSVGIDVPSSEVELAIKKVSFQVEESEHLSPIMLGKLFRHLFVPILDALCVLSEYARSRPLFPTWVMLWSSSKRVCVSGTPTLL
jgi:hypothetical protein